MIRCNMVVADTVTRLLDERASSLQRCYDSCIEKTPRHQLAWCWFQRTPPNSMSEGESDQVGHWNARRRRRTRAGPSKLFRIGKTQFGIPRMRKFGRGHCKWRVDSSCASSSCSFKTNQSLQVIQTLHTLINHLQQNVKKYLLLIKRVYTYHIFMNMESRTYRKTYVKI